LKIQQKSNTSDREFRVSSTYTILSQLGQLQGNDAQVAAFAQQAAPESSESQATH
jgi:hypothetical protein